MKRHKWQILLGIILIFLSVIFYLIHYLIFRDAHHIFIYLIGDIAFVFIEVLLVALIIHEVLAMRERSSLMEKLNMVIGSFFSEVGKDVLKSLSEFDPGSERIRQELIVKDHWSMQEFLDLGKRMKQYTYTIDIPRGDPEHLKQILTKKREFLVRLLENQNLLEHDTFTSLLMALFHLTEELEAREEVRNLPQADMKHIANDIRRVYSLLIAEWLSYMKYLRANYPYLFSFAMRTNPFDLKATPEVKESEDQGVNERK
jgi:hypothetical protein